jgi:N-hydroxyarylamine O-acetyltransferase
VPIQLAASTIPTRLLRSKSSGSGQRNGSVSRKRNWPLRFAVHSISETLRQIHRAHLFSVPFENLDIHLGRKIVCDEDDFLHKIVNERRGGFCYELNGAFASLLRGLGFQVTLLSARVARSDGGDSPEYDHLTLRVDLDEPWLVDVGFGDSFLEALRLKATVEQPQIGRMYRLREVEGVFGLEVMADDKWRREYSFTLQTPPTLRICRYVPLSPDLA